MQSIYKNTCIKKITLQRKKYKLNISILAQRVIALALILIQIAIIKLLQDATISILLAPVSILLLATKENLLDL